MEEVITELQSAAQQGRLTFVQVQIMISKVQGATYRDIIAHFQLSGPTALKHCLARTALGRFWHPGIKGGNDPYLSQIDQARFAQVIIGAVDHASCIATPVARNLAHKLAIDRVRKARCMLHEADCPDIADQISDPSQPCKAWLKAFSATKQINVVSGRDLAALRRAACDHTVIRNFFSEFAGLFNRDPRLIFNMDETSLDSRKKFKVLCTQNRIPLTCSNMRLPHLTGCVTISATGRALRPLIILPKKKKLDDLVDFLDIANFATSTSGWITKHLFTFWVINFVAEIALYRLTLPPELRNEGVLLVVDGHGSRINLDAAILMSHFNIDCLVLPGHSSHILQPFDLCVAAPLKCAFKKELIEAMFPGIEDLIKHEPYVQMKLTAKALRRALVEAFLNAHSVACKPSNIKQGFSSSGLHPIRLENALDHPDLVLLPRIAQQQSSKGKVNSTVLTHPDVIQQVADQAMGSRCDLTCESIFNLNRIIHEIHESTVDDGLPLSPLPQFFLN